MELTTSGMIFLGLAWVIIISLVTFSFYKVFKAEKKK
jgi:hypothetical protein